MIKKSKYAQKTEREVAHEQKVIGLMKAGGWFDPPLSPDEIPKHFMVFDQRRPAHVRHRAVYIILMSRANELGGITKFGNKQFQKALSEHFKLDCSVQQIVNSIKFLKNKKLIAALNTYRSPKVAKLNSTFNDNFGKPRSDRTFLVWTSFYANTCHPVPVGWSGLRLDSRIECEEWTNAIAKIPLKYKIKRQVTVRPNDGEPFELSPAGVDWDYLFSIGAIDEFSWNKILMFIYGRDMRTYVDAFIGIMGRPMHRLHYDNNKTAIDEAVKKFYENKAERLRELKENYGIM